MSAIGGILAGIAVKVGAPIVKQILADRLGAGGEMAGQVIDAIAGKAGVTPAELPQVPEAVLEQAVIQVEAEHGPEWLQLYTAGLRYQEAALLAEQKEGPLATGWRWGWMYLLAFFWLWVIVLVPIVNASTGATIPVVDASILMTLTSWFLALYMGGHTVKELGKSAIEAVRASRART